jgi:hypothetical protein
MHGIVCTRVKGINAQEGQRYQLAHKRNAGTNTQLGLRYQLAHKRNAGTNTHRRGEGTDAQEGCRH